MLLMCVSETLRLFKNIFRLKNQKKYLYFIDINILLVIYFFNLLFYQIIIYELISNVDICYEYEYEYEIYHKIS